MIDEVGEDGEIGELLDALAAAIFFDFVLVPPVDVVLVVKFLMALIRVAVSVAQFPVGP